MLSHVNTLCRINKRNPEKMSLLRMETRIPGLFLHTVLRISGPNNETYSIPWHLLQLSYGIAVNYTSLIHALPLGASGIDMFAKICNISIYIFKIFVIILKDLCVILNVNQGGGFDRRLSAYRLCALKATRTEEPYSSYIKSAIFIFTNPSFFNFPHSPSYYWVDILCSRKLEVCSKAWGFSENSMSMLSFVDGKWLLQNQFK